MVNLEFSLNREILRSNRAGAFSATTIIGCNTRKYHGLLVVPQPQLDTYNHVLLSCVDETIVEGKDEFNLGVHMYQDGVFAPRGHKYLFSYSGAPTPKLTYRVGSLFMTKELIFSEKEARVMIRYTVVEAPKAFTLRIRPFLSFRNVHMLTHENHYASRKVDLVKNGAAWQMYENYSHLFMQFSKTVEYVHFPHWYYNIFYIREFERGYDALEDNYVPGFFELTLKKGDSFVLSAGLEEKNPAFFGRQFDAEVRGRIPRDSFENCLLNSGQQFVIRNEHGTKMWAGFPWFGCCSRDTFLSLPGIALAQGDVKTFKESLDYAVRRMVGPFFSHKYYHNALYYTAVDSPLWFVWNLQKMVDMGKGTIQEIWRRYKKPILVILDGFMEGADFNVKMQDDGLLYAGKPDLALTWMNVFSKGKPLTSRYGLAIEINALWYNALRFVIDVMKSVKDTSGRIQRYQEVCSKIEKSFTATFYNERSRHFYDYVNEEEHNELVRPNMLIAASLPYVPLSAELQKRIFDVVRSELLTIRGLRSLSPNSPGYKGITIGNHSERERAYQMGTVFPWLIAFYADLAIKLYGKGSLPYLKDIFLEFEPAVKENGIGSISEIYDGDPPHEGRGCISQSTSVAALLYLNYLIKNMESNDGKG